MKIIDSQIHTWWPDSPQRPWPAGAVSKHGGEPYLNEMAVAQLDAAGVDAAILVPPSWSAFDNSYALEAAARYPGRFGVMGLFDHTAPQASQTLKTWRDAPGMLGVRMIVYAESQPDLLTNPAHAWFWAQCEAQDLPVMCFVPWHLTELDAVAQRHPRLRLIVDHAGRHPRGPKDDAAWADMPDLLALARHANVAVKVSSLPSFSTQPYPFPNLHPHIRAIHGAFGARRMLWGSDVSRLTSTYDENVRLFSEALDFLSTEDKEWIFWRAATHWCGISA